MDGIMCQVDMIYLIAALCMEMDTLENNVSVLKNINYSIVLYLW